MASVGRLPFYFFRKKDKQGVHSVFSLGLLLLPLSSKAPLHQLATHLFRHGKGFFLERGPFFCQ